MPAVPDTIVKLASLRPAHDKKSEVSGYIGSWGIRQHPHHLSQGFIGHSAGPGKGRQLHFASQPAI